MADFKIINIKKPCTKIKKNTHDEINKIPESIKS